MRVLIQQGKKEYIEHLEREVSVIKPKRYFVRDTSRPYHTEYGEIKAADLKKKAGTVITSSKGKEFVIIDPSFIDIYMQMQRGAQIVPLKDIGSIIASTGVSRDSKVVDAGAGSGAVTCMLANLVKKVTAYEIRDDFYEITRKNIEALGLKNVTLKKGSVYEKIGEKDVDLITLDLPEPWKALPQAKKALKVGGFLVVYNPSIPQISDFVEALDESFELIKIVEVQERHWEFKKRKVRPKSQGIGHSGFMCFARKIR